MKYDNKYSILGGSEITTEHIIGALNIDYICYPEEYHLSEDACIGYYHKNPFIYFIAVDSLGNVVGYINFSPITDNKYEELRSGKYIDTVITKDDILAYEANNKYSVYFSSICVHPQNRKQGVATSLIEELLRFIEELKKQDIEINRIVADAVSDSGYMLLKKLGFSKVRDSSHKTIIMEKVHGT